MNAPGSSSRCGMFTAMLTTTALVAGLAGCSDPPADHDRHTPASQQSQRAPRQPHSFFTGLPSKRGPVLAVKIDNVEAARPHTGLGAADIVYVEQVEAGLSRLLAVYSSRLPSRIGPVRSARESDLELLRQFGHPALAYSGVQSALRPLIESAPIEAMPPGKAPRAYLRGTQKAPPHNLYVDPDRALAAAPGASQAKDIGLHFGPAPGGGSPRAKYTARFPAARFTFSWSRDSSKWLISMDGAPAQTTDSGRLGAATVVIQHVKVRPSRFHDRSGSITPYTETVGSGTALVLRGGAMYEARWKRPDPEAGTVFTTPSGAPMPFAPGPLWVVLTAR